MGFFKTFLKGLGYLLASPFILLGFAIFAVYSIGVFIYESIIWFIKFAKGDKLTTYTAEDEKVYLMLKGEQPSQQQTNITNTTIDNSTNTTDNSSHNTTNKTIINNIIVDNPELAKKLLDGTANNQFLGLDEEEHKEISHEDEIEQIENNGNYDQIEMDTPEISDSEVVENDVPEIDENEEIIDKEKIKVETEKPEIVDKTDDVDENYNFGDFPDFDN